jgi:hypothetical protein
MGILTNGFRGVLWGSQAQTVECYAFLWTVLSVESNVRLNGSWKAWVALPKRCFELCDSITVAPTVDLWSWPTLAFDLFSRVRCSKLCEVWRRKWVPFSFYYRVTHPYIWPKVTRWSRGRLSFGLIASEPANRKNELYEWAYITSISE